MPTQQPEWKCIAQLGDATPLEYGGYWVFIDTTNVYTAEAEYLFVPECEDEGPIKSYSFSLDRCLFVNGVLSDNKFHPEHPAWFAKDLADIAESNGISELEIINNLCDRDPVNRAIFYRMIAEYHGWENFDNYSLELTNDEMIARFNKPVYTVVK